MTWFKVDDAFPEHPKVEALEENPVLWAQAIALWTVVGAYCSRNGTDGHIGIARLRRLTPLGPKAERIAEELVRVGLFERTEAGYLVHDFLDYNPSAEEVEKDRELGRIRQEKSREKKRLLMGGETRDVTPPVTRDITRDDGVTHTVSHSDPSRPDPSRIYAVLVGGESHERTVGHGRLDEAFVDLCSKPLGKWTQRYNELGPFSPYELKCAWLATQAACADGSSKANPGLYLAKLEEVRRAPPEGKRAKGPPTAANARGYHQGSTGHEAGDGPI